MALTNVPIWASALEPTIKTWFHDTLDGYPDMIPSLYNLIGSEKGSEVFQGTSGISADRWDVFRTTRFTPSVGGKPEYEKTFTPEVYTVDLPIDVQVVEDSQFNIVQFQIQELAESAAQKRQEDAASVFNLAFSSTRLGPDGVSLVSDSHPTSPTQDNKGTSALSQSSLEATKVLMMSYKKGSGALSGIIPDLLIVPPALESTAKQLVMSEFLPGSANNDVNPHFGIRYMVWNYLTDANNWFLVDSRRMRRYLTWVNRKPLNIVFEVGKSDENHIVYNARMRYDYGWIDWRWIYGHEVA